MMPLESSTATVGVVMNERENDQAKIVAASEEQTDLAQSARAPACPRTEVEDIVRKTD